MGALIKGGGDGEHPSSAITHDYVGLLPVLCLSSSDWFCNRCVCVCECVRDTVSQATSQTDRSHNDTKARWKFAATHFHSRQI